MDEKADDVSLVRACLAGERDAFAVLLDRYERPVFNVAYRMVRDREDARDVTQSVFSKALGNLDRFDARHRFFSWIYRIAIHESIDLLQRKRRTEPLEIERADDEPGPEDLAGNREAQRMLLGALEDLTPEHRAVIVLRHFHHCSYVTIGEILEISEKTVKSRLFDARRVLRRTLAGKGIKGP